MKTKSTLSNLCILLSFLLFAVPGNAQSPSWQWAKRVGSFNDNPAFSSGDQNERFNDIKVDKVGNVYAVGEFFQNSAFDNQTTGFPTTGGYGERDAYLIKFNKCGKTLWWRRMGGTQRDAAKSLVLDNSGKVIVLAGSGSSTYTVGDGSHDTTIASTNILYLAKFDTAGNFINVVNTFAGFPNFFSASVITKLFMTSQGEYFFSDGMQAAKVNTLGVLLNFYNYTSTSGNVPKFSGITLDKIDNLYLTGAFTGTVNVGGTTVTYTNVSPGLGNSIIVKFSPTGNLLWVKTSLPSGGGGDVLGSCTVDTSGTKVITGGRANLGITVFGYTVPGSSSNGNMFYTFDATNGNLVSATTGSITAQDFISPVYTDKNNRIHCAGTVAGQLAFTTGTYITNPANSTRQSCIGIYDIVSNTVSVNMLPQTGSGAASVKEQITSMAGDTLGNIYVCGMFGGIIDSLGTGVNIIGGSEDGFIAKFGYPCGAAPTATVPNVPLNLAAANASLTNNLTWTDNSNNETNFDLHYTIGSNPNYSLLATLPANTTSYPHTGLSYTTTYCYKVAATNSIGTSAFSNTDCATTPAAPSNTATAPNAPLNLAAANNGSLTNNVTWTDNSSNEAGFNLHYTIGTAGTYSLLAALPANTTSYPHTSLTNTTTYCYKVAATNTVGTSAFSNTGCATTPAAPTNTTDTGIKAVGDNVSQIVCYPNPASSEIYFDVPVSGKRVNIEIYNTLGALVLSKENYGNRSAIDISAFSSGLYYYKIKTVRNEWVGKVVRE
jgi:hypothetical protein